MKKLVAVVSLLVSFNVSAKCNQFEADKGTSNAMRECAYDAFKKADTKLNKIYQEIIQKLKNDVTNPKYLDERALNETLIADLINSQRDWIKFRDSECARVTGINTPNPGREAYLLYSYCPASMTVERIKILTTKCIESDVSCIDYQ